MAKRPISLLRLKDHCVFHLLRLEEALLRKSKRSWCIVNDGVSNPAVVMGISGKKEALVNLEKAKEQRVELIKRFTGGGTVILDRDSILVSLICEAKDTPEVPLFPRPLMSWSKTFYEPVFGPYGDFRLSETDYTFGQLKFGGNAQYISKSRWLHHTSFIWDFDAKRMKCLLHPPKEPDYRKSRTHEDFLTRLKDHMVSRDKLLLGIEDALSAQNFEWEEVGLEEVEEEVKKLHANDRMLISTKRVALSDES